MADHLQSQTDTVLTGGDNVRRSFDPGGILGATPSVTAPSFDLTGFTNQAKDVFVSNGSTYSYTPTLSAGTGVNFSLTHFPYDNTTINPKTGAVSLDTSATPLLNGQRPSRSVFIGIQAQNAAGRDYLYLRLHIGLTAPDLKYVGASETYTNLQAGIAAMSAGKTLIVRNATYTGLNNTIYSSGGTSNSPPAGSSTAWTTVMGETPLGWVINGQSGTRDNCILIEGNYSHPDFPGQELAVNKDYISIIGADCQGSKYGNGSTAVQYGHYMYCHFGDGLDYSGTHNVSPSRFNNSNYVNVECCTAYGYGRYMLSGFHTWHLIVRRCLARLGPYYGLEPNSSFLSFYTSQNCIGQNTFGIDSADNKWIATWETKPGFSHGFQCPATDDTAYPTGNEFNRCGVFNSWNGGWLQYGNAVSAGQQLDVIDCMQYNTGNSSMTRGTTLIGDRSYVDVLRLTAYNVNATGAQGEGSTAFIVDELEVNMSYSATYLLTGSLAMCEIWGSDGGNFDYCSFSGFGGTINLSGGTNTNQTDIALTPANGHMYPGRIERGSALETAGIGAKDGHYCIGKLGTFHGDTDYNASTTTPVFPMQNWREAMAVWRAYSWTGPNQETGLGGSATLSGNYGAARVGDDPNAYILSQAGATPFPMNFAVIQDGANVFMGWDIPENNYKFYIIGYSIYKRNVTDAGSFALLASTDYNTNTYTNTTGLTSGKTYEYYVVANHILGGSSDSGPSYYKTVAYT